MELAVGFGPGEMLALQI